MTQTLRFAAGLALLASFSAVPLGCSSDSDDTSNPGGTGGDSSGSGGGDGAAGAPGTGEDTKYIVGSTVFAENTAGYLAVLDELKGPEVSLDDALEFPGQADVWVHEGSVFVSGGDSPTITKYTLNEDGSLESEGKLNFNDYGVIDVAFWNNTFVAKDKGYLKNGTSEYIIWNPETMKITGTLEIPEQEEVEGLLVRLGTADRSNIVRDGKLYQPIYWSDANYALMRDVSKIAVFDVVNDEFVELIDAPCPGLDVGTIDEDGKMYFSPWTGPAGTHLMLDTPEPCVVSLQAGEHEAEVAFRFSELTEGRQGAAVKYLGDGKLLFPVFHHDQVNLADFEDPFSLIGTENWKLWTYDPETGDTAIVEDVADNSGAIYTFNIDGKLHINVPGASYADTATYVVNPDASAEKLFDVQGWAIRLFRVR